MIDNDNAIYIYDYLDVKASEMREKVLLDYLNDASNTSKLEFMDLGFYIKNNSCIKRIESIAHQSVLDNNIILSDSQIEILSILNDKNLFISAPTSFGKTFIVLEFMIRHPELNNIVFIVPTLALMNELLKKIYDNFGENYNICINGDEKLEEKNIFIFVPERSDNEFVKLITSIGLDLLVIDEIYKLKPKNKKELNDDDRIILMNKVYLNLLKSAKKIVLLGPFIKDISFNQTKLDIVKYYTNLSPVYNFLHKCPQKNWLDYIGEEKELVYFNSPESIYTSLDKIIDRFNENIIFIDRYKKEIEYLEKLFFNDWYGIKLLKRGIGVHHGKTPMFLRKFYENEYRNGSLKCLLCTSTLMEVVNTPTMKLIVVDDPGSTFRLNNLIGRVGRLNVNKPAAGNIYLFNNKACKLIENRNVWESLTILSEDEKISSADEVLFLDKKFDNGEKKEEYNLIINTIINTSGKRLDEIKKYDIRVKTAYKFVEKDYYDKFIHTENIKECIRLSCELLGKISFKFDKKLFSGIIYPFNTLPYLVFMDMMIQGKNYGEIINYFEEQYGILSIKNKNLLTDKLLELRTYIKFKLSKIINYFELYNVDYNKYDVLRFFASKLKSFCELDVTAKILEDLGVEECDFSQLKPLIGNIDDISTSIVIKTLRKNKDRINQMSISPFTKRNIQKL